jgi:hypothetical protein
VCGRERVEARGLCHAHYLRWRNGAAYPAPLIRTPKNKYQHCTVDGCRDAHYAKGLCSRHYKRRWAGLPLTGATIAGEAPQREVDRRHRLPHPHAVQPGCQLRRWPKCSASLMMRCATWCDAEHGDTCDDRPGTTLNRRPSNPGLGHCDDRSSRRSYVPQPSRRIV